MEHYNSVYSIVKHLDSAAGPLTAACNLLPFAHMHIYQHTECVIINMYIYVATIARMRMRTSARAIHTLLAFSLFLPCLHFIFGYSVSLFALFSAMACVAFIIVYFFA